MIGIALALFFGVILAVPLFSLTGEQATLFLLDERILPSTSSGQRDVIYDRVEGVTGYFLGIGLIHAVSLPVLQYLFFSLSFYEIQRISGVVFFLIGNICLIASFFGDGDNVNSQVLIAELFGLHGLAMVGYLYEWCKVSDLEYVFSENLEAQTQKKLLFTSNEERVK